MWQALMDWLPDLKVGAFELRDVLSLGMAVLGAYLAWLAIRMGKKQASIVEMQHQIVTRQLGRDIKWKVFVAPVLMIKDPLSWKIVGVHNSVVPFRVLGGYVRIPADLGVYLRDGKGDGRVEHRHSQDLKGN